MYGDPKIDEPLSAAWQRAVDHLLGEGQDSTSTDVSDFVSSLFRKKLIDSGDLRTSLSEIFASAPDWLLVLRARPLTRKSLGSNCPNHAA
jgi:hypothetical protein